MAVQIQPPVGDLLVTMCLAKVKKLMVARDTAQMDLHAIRGTPKYSITFHDWTVSVIEIIQSMAMQIQGTPKYSIININTIQKVLLA